MRNFGGLFFWGFCKILDIHIWKLLYLGNLLQWKCIIQLSIIFRKLNFGTTATLATPSFKCKIFSNVTGKNWPRRGCRKRDPEPNVKFFGEWNFLAVRNTDVITRAIGWKIFCTIGNLLENFRVKYSTFEPNFLCQVLASLDFHLVSLETGDSVMVRDGISNR